MTPLSRNDMITGNVSECYRPVSVGGRRHYERMDINIIDSVRRNTK